MKGAIFDVDGTLLDSMPVWWRATEKFCKNHNIDMTAEKFAEYNEMRLEDSLPQIRAEHGLEMSVDEMISELRCLVFEEYRDFVLMKPRAKEYVEKLHNEGVKIAIATSGYEGLCKAAFERLGVWDLIDARAFSDEVGVNKSNPDVYLLAAQRLGLNPSECVVFEDIATGIGGAKKGGFKTCAVYDESNADKTETLKELADMYITDFGELL